MVLAVSLQTHAKDFAVAAFGRAGREEKNQLTRSGDGKATKSLSAAFETYVGSTSTASPTPTKAELTKGNKTLATMLPDVLNPGMGTKRHCEI